MTAESTTPAPLRTLYSLQYMRALAALAVLFVHAITPLHARYPLLTRFGLILNLFFVISGFLLVIITNAETRPLDFIRDRIARIVPLYWVATGITLLVLWPGIVYAVPFSLGQVLKSYLFIPSLHPADPLIRPVVPQGWTLNLEMLYYSIFALALFLPRRWQVPAVTMLLVPAGIIGMIWQPAGPILFMWTLPIGFNFVVGLWIGTVWLAGRSLRPVVMWTALGAIGFVVLAWVTKLPHDDRIHPLGMFPVALLFIVLLVRERRPGGIERIGWLKKIGDASYSIYLFHFLAILAWDGLARHWPIDPWLYAAGVFFSGLAIGFAAYFWIERPFVRLFKRQKPVVNIPKRPLRSA